MAIPVAATSTKWVESKVKLPANPPYVVSRDFVEYQGFKRYLAPESYREMIEALEDFV